MTTPTKPGIIRHHKAIRQVAKFNNMVFGSISPTNIDCLIEFKNKLFVIAEAKRKGVNMPRGQRLAIERLFDTLDGTDGKRAIAFILSHDTSEDFDIANTKVVKSRWNKKWVTPREPINFYEAVKNIYSKFVV